MWFILFPCFVSFFPYIFTSSFWSSWSVVAMFVGGMEITDCNVTTAFGKMGKLDREMCHCPLLRDIMQWDFGTDLFFLACTGSVLDGRPGLVCVIRAWGDRKTVGLFWKGRGTNNIIVWHYCKIIIIKVIFFCLHKNNRQYFPDQISNKPSSLSCNTELLVEKQELNLCLECISQLLSCLTCICISYLS